MYIHQKDLLVDMDKKFVRRMMDLGIKETHQKGEVLFREQDPATNLYILTKGHVRLSVGSMGQTIYLVNHPGEGFGWSSILGGSRYTATAECVKQSEFYRIESQALTSLLESEPEIGMIFFRKIATILSIRLVHLYERILPQATATTFGTGQVQDYPEAP